MLKSLGANTLLMTLGIMFNKVAILAINVLLARYSSTELYGKFALLRNSVNLIETTMSSSINPVVIRASAADYGNEFSFPRTNSFLLVLGLAIATTASTLLWLFADTISLNLFDDPDPHYVHLGILLLLATNSSGLVASFLVTGRATIYLPVASIAAALVAVSLAYLFVPGNPVFWAILSLVVLHGFEFTLKLGFAVWKKILSIRGLGRLKRDALAVFSASLVILILSSAANAVTFWLLRVILVQVNSNFTPLALFDVSFQYLAVEMMVLNNVVTIFQSRAAHHSGADARDLRRVYISGIQLLGFVTVAASAVNLVFADFLIGLYGADYEPQMLRVLTLVLPFYAMAVFMNRTFVNIGRPRVLLLVSLVSSAAALLYAYLVMADAYQLAFAFVIYFAVSDLVYLASLARLRLGTPR